jgi:hypothetical protein
VVAASQLLCRDGDPGAGRDPTGEGAQRTADGHLPPEHHVATSGRIPLAVVVVDGDGLVSHWSSGARRLTGVAREEAVGVPVLDLLPVAGAPNAGQEDAAESGGLPSGPGPDSTPIARAGCPTAGRAHLSDARDAPSTCWGGRIRWSAPALSGCWC